jgi:hypothetical protein
VLSCIKSPVRREWLSHRARLVEAWRLAELHDVRVDALSDAEAAAYVWGAHMRTFADLWRRFSPRLLPLDAAELTGQPTDTAARVASFLELPADAIRAHTERIVGQQVHAKTGVPFSPASRQDELQDVAARVGDQLDQARRWCAARRLPTRGSAYFVP